MTRLVTKNKNVIMLLQDEGEQVLNVEKFETRLKRTRSETGEQLVDE